MTDKPTTVNTTDIDYGLPSLPAIAGALELMPSWGLPHGFTLNSVDFSDCLRPGARDGEIIVTGDGPDEIVDEWDDDPADLEPGEEPQHHVERERTYWGFRIRIDQIATD